MKYILKNTPCSTTTSRSPRAPARSRASRSARCQLAICVAGLDGDRRGVPRARRDAVGDVDCGDNRGMSPPASAISSFRSSFRSAVRSVGASAASSLLRLLLHRRWAWSVIRSSPTRSGSLTSSSSLLVDEPRFMCTRCDSRPRRCVCCSRSRSRSLGNPEKNLRSSLVRSTHGGGGATPSAAAAAQHQWWQLCSTMSYSSAIQTDASARSNLWLFFALRRDVPRSTRARKGITFNRSGSVRYGSWTVTPESSGAASLVIATLS